MPGRRGERALQSTDPASLSAELPPPLRLAVAYAPRRARAAWTALLALDRRLERAALGAGEPLIGQVRLAWWRDRFREAPQDWPQGEPLLAALAAFGDETTALEGLVDGWELLVGADPDTAAITSLADARAEAVVALARVLGCATRLDAVAARARLWALADLARTLESDPARQLAQAADSRTAQLPRLMRPLVILADLPRWGDVRPLAAPGLGALLRIVRLGMFGR